MDTREETLAQRSLALSRGSIIALAVANLVGAVAVYGMFAAGTAVAAGVIMSTYRELDVNVVDHEKLRELWGEEYVEDWGKVVHRLGGESLVGLGRTGTFVAVLFAINGILLLLIVRCLPRKGELSNPRPPLPSEPEGTKDNAH